MKKILTLLLIASVPVLATAQSSTFSIGMRGGVSSMARLDKNLHGEGKTVACNTELFGRYQAKSGWAFEGGISVGRYKSPTVNPPVDDVYFAQADPRIHEQYTRRDYQFTAKAQYAISDCSGCCHGHSCAPAGIKPRFRNYVGVAVSYLNSGFAYQGDQRNTDGSVTGYSRNYHDGSLWAGLSNTIVMDVCPKVQVSGGFQWMANVAGGEFLGQPVGKHFDYFYGQQANSQMLFQLGAGFKL